MTFYALQVDIDYAVLNLPRRCIGMFWCCGG